MDWIYILPTSFIVGDEKYIKMAAFLIQRGHIYGFQNPVLGVIQVVQNRMYSILNLILPHSAVISGLWPWFSKIWGWFPMFLWSYHRKKHHGRKRIDHGRQCGMEFTLWVCIPQKSLAIARDFWNTNSLGRTPLRTIAHDGLSISCILSLPILGKLKWYFWNQHHLSCLAQILPGVTRWFVILRGWERQITCANILVP